MNKILGCLSEKYESSGNPGAISKSKEDAGNRYGGSYGAFQMIVPTVKSYLVFIQSKYPDIYNVLIKTQIASPEFDTLWKSLAQNVTARFKESQWAFIKISYYDGIASKINTKYGFDINKRSFALQNTMWSTSVQHGTGGALSIFDIAVKGKDIKTITDEYLIRAIYSERGRNNGKAHFSSCSANVQKAVANRFKNELQDALVLLKQYPIPIVVKPVVPVAPVVVKKEVIDLTKDDGEKLIKILSNLFEIVTTEQDKAEFHRLANEIRKNSGIPLVD